MTAPDSDFAGTSGQNLPEADLDFSCKADNEVVHPEVVVDVKQDLSTEQSELESAAEELGADTEPLQEEEEQWVRIPVTECVEWVNKDGPADMTRTARVKFPMEWGGHSIVQYINGFNSQNNLAEQNDPYDECRIFYFDHDRNEWVVAHYGYVGGVGPANDNNGVGKFWVYDPADLMKGIQVSKSWGEPSMATVLEFVRRGVDDTGDEVGIELRSVFENEIPVSFVGKQEIPQTKQEDVREMDPEGFAITGSLPVVGSFRLPVPGLVGDLFESVAETFIDPLMEGQKRFQLNRHNMVDMMDWFTNLIDARWWFEPAPGGPILCVDASAYKSGVAEGNYERRYFVDEAVTNQFETVQQKARQEATEEAEDFGREFQEGETIDINDDRGDFLPPHNYNMFATVDTLNNNALVDIKPFNTLYLYGESSTYGERYATADAPASPGLYTEKFPWVKVTYEPLLDRAGGYEYSSQPIESDKIHLEDAEQQAKKEFREHVAEQTEGSMQLRGEPHIMPYDYLFTVPACNNTYQNANAEPMTWEVNGVKHIRKAGEPYKTELAVSLTVEDRLLNVESEYREA